MLEVKSLLFVITIFSIERDFVKIQEGAFNRYFWSKWCWKIYFA